MAVRRVALIRGINVGTAKRVAMADLRALLESLGCRDVRTLLNSGNAVFTPPSRPVTAAALEKAMNDRLGVSARVAMLTGAELEEVAKANPLAEVADNPSRLLVAFALDSTTLATLKPLVRQNWHPERLAVGARAAYLWCPDGISASRLPEAVGQALHDGVTMRNWATVQKIRALL